jgi:methionyl-tRNA formyltransferase
MRIIFMGSPAFAVPTLDALVEAGHEVVCVYTQPPRPAGRGKADRPTAVEDRARSLGLDVRTPKSESCVAVRARDSNCATPD